MKRSVIICAVLSAAAFFSCGSKGKLVKEVFSYRGIMDREFRFKTGDIVPVTIEQSVELDGDISLDGKYFYYSSNRDIGNYDIYLRLLNNITTLRLTNHPSRDTSPAISPDGRKLLFVSTREDPEGDIYLVKINPDRLIGKAEESITELPSLDSEVRNLTQYQDTVTKTIRIIKDASPVWSPDGKRIAFSSTREGIENIWTMENDGTNLTRLTSKGGTYPRFSPDGKEIIFISYRDPGKRGDIYTINLATKRETRITDTPSIELMPSYRGNSSEIIYTLIDRDTDGDGKITLKDNSVLTCYNITSKKGYPLTLYSESSFSARWLPVLETQTYKGTIIYSNLVEGNVNINLIPETGIIPRWSNARLQYQNAKKYITELNNREKYLLALERVYDFFGAKRDRESEIYTSKALSIAAYEFSKSGLGERRSSVMEKLKEMSGRKNIYSRARYGYTLLKLRGKRGDDLIKDNIKKALSDRKNSYFLPYLLEDLVDEYLLTGRKNKAAAACYEIINNHKKYNRLISVHYKLARLKYTRITDPISGSIELVLKRGSQYQKKEMVKHIVGIIESSSRSVSERKILEGLLKKFPGEKRILGIIYYSLGDIHLRDKDYKRAEEYYQTALKNILKSDVLYYRANTRLGDIALINKDRTRAENFISTAVNRYKNVWREPDIRERALWLINYYESKGERAEDSGNYGQSVTLYQKYHRLMTFLNIRKFTALYNKYGPRSHILYIDAYTRLHGRGKIDNLLKEYVGDVKRKRQDFDKAYIYGLAYVYTLKALHVEKETGITNLNIPGLSDIPGLNKTGLEGLLINFQNALEQVEWALFLDDTFIEPYLLKSWIYMYVDLKRTAGDGKDNEKIDEFFPRYLWEKNIAILEKALSSNDESRQSENEGNIHINIANNYFLLSNFPRALDHYTRALKYKKNFGTRIEEALFYFHTGYCYWQNNNLPDAREEMKKSLNIYTSLSSGGNTAPFAGQIFTLYKYFALFNRMEEKYPEAIRWYKKTMAYASQHRIRIDRARYLQEIAYCYKKTGDLDAARANLMRAGELLRTYPPGEKTYKPTITMFYLFSFPVPYDLGQDSAVVGDNKIFTELTKRDKELLNISLLEDISVERGNYRKAIDYQLEKIKLIKKKENKIDQVSLTTSLNNTGYYFYKLRNYTGAMDYFRRAWKHASHEDVNDLDGAFAALMNLTNLYAFVIENDLGILKDPGKEISLLVKNANEFRAGYEEKTYKKELKKLEASAKEKKKKVEDKEKTQLRRDIAQKARSIYSTIDTATAVLDFYRAELLSAREIKPEGSGTDTAFSYYRESRGIYDLYSLSLKRFTDALKRAREGSRKKPVIKLMMNIASCYSEMGDVDEAYMQYLDAIDLAKKYEHLDLLLHLYSKTGNFLMEYGEEAEGDNYPVEALSYFEKGIELFERYPYFFADSFTLIRKYYDSSIDIQLRLKRQNDAFVNCEKRYDAVRYFMVAGTSPSFFREKDNTDYNSYLKETRLMKEQMRKLSLLLERGAAEDSEEAVKLKNDLGRQEKKIRTLLLGLEKEKRLLASYLSVKYRGIPELKDSTVIRLHKSGERVTAWKVRNGKIRTRGFDTKNNNWTDRLADFMTPAGKKKELFIVLDRSSREILTGSGLNKKLKSDFMFIPSVSRISSYRSSANMSISSIYYSGTGLKNAVALPEIKISEGLSGTTDLTGFTALVDKKGSTLLEPALFFRMPAQSSFIIKNVNEIDYDYAALLAESALYSGITTIVISENAGTDTLGKILSSAYENGFSSVNSNPNFQPLVFSIGYRGITAGQRKSEMADIRKDEFRLYGDNLKKRDFMKAGIHLKRWASGTEETSIQRRYKDLSFKLSLISGDTDSALKQVREREKTEGEEQKADVTSLMRLIYLHLYRGDLNAAYEILEKPETGAAADYYDYHVYKAIEKLTSRGAQSSLEYYKDITEKTSGLKSALERERINLLYGEYLALFNKTSPGLLPGTLSGDKLSDRERVKASLLGFRIKEITALQSPAGKILKLLERKDLSDSSAKEIQDLLQQNSSDSLSSVLLIAYLENRFKTENNTPYREGIQNQKLEEILKRSYLTDRLLLLKREVNYYRLAGNMITADKLLERYISQLKKNNINSLLKNALYDRSILLSRLKKYPASCRYAEEASRLAGDTEPLSTDIQLNLIDCESSLNKDSQAVKRADLLLNKKIAPEQEFILNLLRSRLELKKLSRLKQATVEDAKTFDALFTGSMTLLDRNPGMIPEIKRINLVREIIDSYINYKMKTGNHTDALLFSEIKKEILLRHRFRDFEKEKLLKNIPISKIMSKIPEDSLMVSLTRIGDDIFIWILGKKFRKAEVVRKGYSRLEPVLREYRELISRFDNTISVSKKLNGLFTPLLKNLKGKKTLYIVTDNSLEKIPFEIIGAREMLIDKYNLYYLTSPMAFIKKASLTENNVYLFGDKKDSIHLYLEDIALEESGIGYRAATKIHKDIAHIHSPVTYNRNSRKLYMGKSEYREVIQSPSLVYLPDLNINGIGFTDLSLYNSRLGVTGIIINGTSVHEMNNALFIDSFYRELQKKITVREAFGKAKESIRNNSIYKHPAYWAGIRFYINKM